MILFVYYLRNNHTFKTIISVDNLNSYEIYNFFIKILFNFESAISIIEKIIQISSYEKHRYSPDR
jgi:hypothetical protein